MPYPIDDEKEFDEEMHQILHLKISEDTLQELAGEYIVKIRDLPKSKMTKAQKKFALERCACILQSLTYYSGQINKVKTILDRPNYLN